MFTIRSFSVVLFFLWIWSLDAKAQLITDNEFHFQFKGEHELYFHFPLSNGGDFQYPLTSPKSLNRFGLNLSQKNIRLVSEWELRFFLPQSGNQEDAVLLIPKENYIRYSTRKMNWTFGLQKYSWGMADHINPTNNLNPLDYTITGFEPEEIPVFSSSVEYFPRDSWKMQAVYIPFEQSDNIFWSYPEAIPGALFAKYVISDFDFNTQIPATTTIAQEKQISEIQPDYGLRSGVFGGRLNFYSSKVDLSLSYVYDFDPYFTPFITTEKYFPGITGSLEDKFNQTLNAEEASQVISYLSGISSYRISQIDLLRKRIHRFGGNAKTIIGRFGLWLEACYSITEQANSEDYKNRGNDLFFVLGTDFFFGPNERFYGNIQYTGKWIPNYYHSFYSEYPGGIPQAGFQDNEEYVRQYYYRALVQPLGFQSETYLHGVTVNFDFSFFNGKLKPSLVGYLLTPDGYDKAEKTRSGSLLLMPSVDYSPGNALHFILGSYLSWSAYKENGGDQTKYNDSSSILGLLNPYNNLYVKISYSWNHNK